MNNSKITTINCGLESISADIRREIFDFDITHVRSLAEVTIAVVDFLSYGGAKPSRSVSHLPVGSVRGLIADILGAIDAPNAGAIEIGNWKFASEAIIMLQTFFVEKFNQSKRNNYEKSLRTSNNLLLKAME